MEQQSFEFATAEAPAPKAPRLDPYRPTLAEVVDDYIVKTLEYCDGNVSKAARILGINRRTIMRRRKGKV